MGLETLAAGTLGKVALGASVASSALSTVGALQQGQAADSSARFQAAVLEQQAQREEELNREAVRRQRAQASATAATARARLGASGARADTGTPSLVLSQFERDSEFQALLAESLGVTNVERRRQQADLTRREGRSARRASFFRAGTRLAGGALSGLSVAREFELGPFAP